MAERMTGGRGSISENTPIAASGSPRANAISRHFNLISAAFINLPHIESFPFNKFSETGRSDVHIVNVKADDGEAIEDGDYLFIVTGDGFFEHDVNLILIKQDGRWRQASRGANTSRAGHAPDTKFD
jgi:hypothetical protein